MFITIKVNNNNKDLHSILLKNINLENFQKFPNKIQIVTIETRNNDMLKIHNKCINDYCKRHGYTYTFLSNYKNDLKLPIYWWKLQYIKELLQRNSFQYIMWLDSDTIICKPEILLEYIIILSGQSSILIGKDFKGYNAGVFIIKNNDIGKHFINECINTYLQNQKCIINGKYVLNGIWAGECYEQGVMNNLINGKYSQHTFNISKEIVTNDNQLPKNIPFIFHNWGNKDKAAKNCKILLDKKYEYIK